MNGRAVILLYHRVAAARTDPFGLCVTPATLDTHLEYLRAHCDVLALETLADEWRSGTLRDGSVALTFDDGYLDNLTDAVPLLDRHAVPATFFLTTGDLGPSQQYWWDRLADAVFASDRIADVDRRSLLTHWHGTLRPLGSQEREAALRSITDSLGSHTNVASGRRLDADEVRTLAHHSRHSIGVHTVTHVSLPAQTEETQWRELTESRSALIELTGQRVAMVAYPFGDCDDLTTRLAAAAGFQLGVTTEPRALRNADDPLRLPRVEIREQTNVAALLQQLFDEASA